MKRLFFSLILISPLHAMEEDRPHYHINNKVVYLKETHESGDHEFQTVTDFNNAIERQNAIMSEVVQSVQKRKEEDIAIIKTGASNRTKVIVASLGTASAIVIALISSLTTYYSKKC